MGYRIETYAIEAAAPFLPELRLVLPDDAPAFLDSLPAGPTLQRMVREEKRAGLLWEIQEMRKAEQQKPGSWQVVWKNLVDPPWLEAPSRDLDLIQSVKTYEQAMKRLEDLVPFYDELAKIIALPWKEFDAKYPELVKKAKIRDPWGFDRLNEPGGILARVRRYQTQMALFKAALAVVKGGPDKLKDIQDPFGERAIRVPIARSRLRAQVEAELQGPAGDSGCGKRDEVICGRVLLTMPSNGLPGDPAPGRPFFTGSELANPEPFRVYGLRVQA